MHLDSKGKKLRARESCEHDFPPSLLQTYKFSLLSFRDCWHLNLSLCFGLDPLSYLAPNWKGSSIWRQSIMVDWKQVN